MAPLATLRNYALSGIGLARRETEKRLLTGYKLSPALTTVGLVMYVVASVALMWRFKKYTAKYMIAMIVGAIAYSVGLAFRYALMTDKQTLTIYIVQFSLLALSPCAMIASIYAILSRLAYNLKSEKHLVISAKRITLIFILSDVLTFLVQSTGGTMSSGNDPDKRKLGQNLFLIGLILQVISFLLFTIIYIIFLRRVAQDSKTWQRDARESKFDDWRYLAGTVVVTCVCILIRSVYRIIEAKSMGDRESNSWFKCEGAFYILDATPIWISLACFATFWPGRILQPRAALMDSSSQPGEYYPLGAGGAARLPLYNNSSSTMVLPMGKTGYQ